MSDDTTPTRKLPTYDAILDAVRAYEKGDGALSLVGRYLAEWRAAIERLTRERDEARAPAADPVGAALAEGRDAALAEAAELRAALAALVEALPRCCGDPCSAPATVAVSDPAPSISWSDYACDVCAQKPWAQPTGDTEGADAIREALRLIGTEGDGA